MSIIKKITETIKDTDIADLESKCQRIDTLTLEQLQDGTIKTAIDKMNKSSFMSERRKLIVKECIERLKTKQFEIIDRDYELVTFKEKTYTLRLRCDNISFEQWNALNAVEKNKYGKQRNTGGMFNEPAPTNGDTMVCNPFIYFKTIAGGEDVKIENEDTIPNALRDTYNDIKSKINININNQPTLTDVYKLNVQLKSNPNFESLTFSAVVDETALIQGTEYFVLSNDKLRSVGDYKETTTSEQENFVTIKMATFTTDRIQCPLSNIYKRKTSIPPPSRRSPNPPKKNKTPQDKAQEVQSQSEKVAPSQIGVLINSLLIKSV